MVGASLCGTFVIFTNVENFPSVKIGTTKIGNKCRIPLYNENRKIIYMSFERTQRAESNGIIYICRSQIEKNIFVLIRGVDKYQNQ